MATTVDKTPVNLLSLDGGGIRGVSELLILHELMQRLQNDLGLDTLPRPCDYFHLIGGTSTGGLIALMLGRLQMTTLEALQQYNKLAGKIFSKENKKWSTQDGTFKSSTLEAEMKRLVAARTGGDVDALMVDKSIAKGKGTGRAFVCAMAASNMTSPLLFRSYRVRNNNTANCSIWQAARATTAAPTFFKRISIAEPGLTPEEFVDAGIKCNNPAEEIIKEAIEVFGPDRPVGCVISIGTGLREIINYEKPDGFQKLLPIDLIKTLKLIATDCDATAARLTRRFINGPQIYFRLNVNRGMDSVGLDEWNKMKDITSHTGAYLRDAEVSKYLNVAVKILQEQAHPEDGSAVPSPVPLGSISGDMGTIEYNKNLKLQQEDINRDKIENWLSPLNFVDKQQEILKLRCPSTDQWLLETPEFQYWTRGPKPWEMRCYGDAGAGKTVMSSLVVEQLKKTQPGRPVLCVYLERYPPGEAQTKEHLLGSLLRQLVQFRKPGISEVVRKAWEDANAKPTLSDIKALLKAEIATHERVYVIIDGVDETTMENRKMIDILDSPDEFFYYAGGKVSVLIAMREDEERSPVLIRCDICGEEDVTLYYTCKECGNVDVCYACKERGAVCRHDPHHTLVLVGNVEVTIRAPDGDIETYLNTVIRRQMGEETGTGNKQHKVMGGLDTRKIPQGRHKSKLGEECLKDPDLIRKVSTEIVRKADHNFRFAKMYMDFLIEKMTRREINNVLDNLPDKLKDDYERDMTDRIMAQQSDNRDIAMKILSLVYTTRQPLRLAELRHALAVEPKMKVMDEDIMLDKKGILKITHGLITIDRDKYAYVRLFHVSFLEYLSQTAFRWFPDAELQMAETCLLYLNLDVFAEPCPQAEDFETKEKDYPFVGYATQFWGDHVRACNSDETTAMAVAYLYQTRRLAAYIQAAWFTTREGAVGWDVRRDIDPLHVCAWFGLVSVFEVMYTEDRNINAVEQTYGQTPLIYACRRGHVEIVQKLLMLGASVNTRSSKGRTPLFEAIEQRNTEIATLLLDHPELRINEVNPKKFSRTALLLATRQGDIDLVRLILTHQGLLLNQADSDGYTALSLAAYIGHENIVREILARSEVDLEIAENSGNRTALSLACEQGNTEIVEELLRQNANASMRDKFGGTAMLRACEGGSIHVIRVLLNFDVDLTAVDETGRTILHGAAANGDPDILSLIHARGLPVDARDNNGLTPLHEATRCGNLEAVNTLLGLGADLRIRDNFGRIPFTIAWQYGYKEVSSFLKTKGPNAVADVAQDIRSESLPLWALIRRGENDLIRTGLASKKLDVATKEPCNNYTALHCAVAMSSIEILALLVSLGTLNLDDMDHDGCTPLLLACLANNIPAVSLLLSQPPSVPPPPSINTPNRWSLTPIYNAYMNTDMDLAVLLIAAGADIDKDRMDTETLLTWAVKAGNAKAAKRLLDLGADVLGRGGGEEGVLRLARSLELAFESGVGDGGGSYYGEGETGPNTIEYYYGGGGNADVIETSDGHGDGGVKDDDTRPNNDNRKGSDYSEIVEVLRGGKSFYYKESKDKRGRQSADLGGAGVVHSLGKVMGWFWGKN